MTSSHRKITAINIPGISFERDGRIIKLPRRLHEWYVSEINYLSLINVWLFINTVFPIDLYFCVAKLSVRWPEVDFRTNYRTEDMAAVDDKVYTEEKYIKKFICNIWDLCKIKFISVNINFMSIQINFYISFSHCERVLLSLTLWAFKSCQNFQHC